ncbi:MAG: thioesterase II family protein [Oscillospiraceae bacterium]
MYIMKVFCFSYAGGSATTLYNLKSFLNGENEIIPIELSGKGKRMSEPPYKDFKHLVSDVCNEIKSTIIDGEQICLLGYSMGSIIAYEVAQKLLIDFNIKVEKIFALACLAPNIKGRKNIHTLSDDEFTSELVKIGGMTKEILEDKEILEYYLPIIRNDFKLLYEYRFDKEAEKLSCDIVCIYSNDEEIRGEIRQWSNVTNGDVSYYKINDGHFFINTSFNAMIDILKKYIY